jgi:acetyl-CoA C-acetyltransferase
MKDVVIVSACRTPIGTFGGTLKTMTGVHLASVTMKEAVNRAGIDPEIIEDVRYGCCMEPVDASTGSVFPAWKPFFRAWP